MIEKKIEILKEIFPSFRLRKQVEFVTYCPSPECKKHNAQKQYAKMKLEINLVNDRFACWRCHYKGHSLKLLKKYGTASQSRKYAALCGLNLIESVDAVEQRELELPAEYQFVLDSNSNLAVKCQEWLKKVGVTERTIIQNKIGFCSSGKYRDRLLFPSIDSNGKLNYFITRHMFNDGNFKWLKCEKSLKQTIYNDIFVDWSQPVILVETVKTYLKHFNLINNMIVCNGSYISKEYLLFSKIVLEDCPKVFVAFDEDARREALRTLNNFDEFGIPCSLVDLKNQSDSCSSEDFIEAINNSKSFDKISLIKNKINNLI